MSRRFSEDQVYTILNRAIKRQAAAQSTAPDHGLTTEEIQRIASEVGVDPTYVSAAILDLDQPTAHPSPSTLWGGPLRHEIERTIVGDLTPDVVGEMVGEIRAVNGSDRGHVETLGNTFEWTPTPGNITLRHVRASAKDGKVRLQVSEKFSNYAFLMHLWTFFPVFASIMVMFTKQNFGLAAGLLALGATLFVAAFFALRSTTKHRTENLEKLVDRLEQVVLHHTPTPAATTTPALSAPPIQPVQQDQVQPGQVQQGQAPQPQLDLDQILHDAPERPATSRRSRRIDTYGGLD